MKRHRFPNGVTQGHRGGGSGGSRTNEVLPSLLIPIPTLHSHSTHSVKETFVQLCSPRLPFRVQLHGNVIVRIVNIVYVTLFVPSTSVKIYSSVYFLP